MNTPNSQQTPDAVREAAQAVLDATPHAEMCELHLDLGPRTNLCSCDHIIRAMLAFAVLDSRAGDAGEGVREGRRVRLESGETGVVNRIDYVVQLDEADGTQGSMGGSVGIITVQADEISATPAVDAVPADQPSRIEAIDNAIRIGIFNTCMQRSMSQDAAIAIVRGTMEQLCVASALAKGKDL